MARTWTVVVPITKASGAQWYSAEADTAAEAVKIVQRGEGEFEGEEFEAQEVDMDRARVQGGANDGT